MVHNVGVVDDGLEGDEMVGLVIGNVKHEAGVGRVSRWHFSSRKSELQVSNPWKIDDDDDYDANCDDDDGDNNDNRRYDYKNVYFRLARMKLLMIMMMIISL